MPTEARPGLGRHPNGSPLILGGHGDSFSHIEGYEHGFVGLRLNDLRCLDSPLDSCRYLVRANFQIIHDDAALFVSLRDHWRRLFVLTLDAHLSPFGGRAIDSSHLRLDHGLLAEGGIK